MWQDFIELGSFLAALAMGMLAYRHMGTAFRLLCVQVAVWSLFYGLMYATIQYQKANGIQPDNRWLMNIHMVLETVLLTVAAAAFIRTRWGNRVAAVALALFFAVWGLQAVTDGFYTYLNYADVAECIIISALYALVLYRFFVQHTHNWWATPEIVLCLGLLLYFACSVPYMAMMRHLQENNPELNHYLFDYISNVLASIRYLLTATAFWLAGRSGTALIPAR